jgi:hypothetical protein
MTKRLVAATYSKYLVETNLERYEVFKTMQRWASSATVLYPGSFIHITPSFFYQHVVYVDRNPVAERFFADTAGVLGFVTSRKHYKQQPFIRFIAQDYTAALPLLENTFDLLISLYAGSISRACKPYVKAGGILLSNNHCDDAGEAARSRDFKLIAVMHHTGHVCQVTETDLDGYFVPKKAVGTRAHARYRSTKSEYARNADYYIFEKARSPAG